MPKFNIVSGDKNILIIDDDEAIRLLVAKYLQKNSSWDITHAGNGKEGLEKLKSLTPDIILCDIIMPEMNGLEFFNTVKNYDTHCNIPFLFMSARDRKEDKMLGFQLGADDYIVKPFRSVELVARLNAALMRYDRAREVYQPVNINGSLMIHTVKDILKMPAIARGDRGTLVIEDSEYKPIGALYLRNGVILNAVYNNTWGIESAYSLFEVQSGFYTYYPNSMNNHVTPGINQSIAMMVDVPPEKNPYMI